MAENLFLVEGNAPLALEIRPDAGSGGDPVASIDQNCVGCGNCGEVADAAILCPSFYRADVIHNPSPFDRRLAKIRAAITGWLQQRRDRKRLMFAEVA